MWISGTGITSFEARIKPNFRPKTELAIKWQQRSDGNYVGTDRGSSSDVYNSEIRLYAKEEEINTFIDEIESNRQNYSNFVTMSDFSDTEHIFGADVDHSAPMQVTVLKMDTKKQGTWKGFGLKVMVRALSPAFTGTGSLPTFKWLSIGYSGDSKPTILKPDSYDGTFAYMDHEADAGTFKGVLTLTDADMIAFRRYIATRRTQDYTINDIYGVEYPFGSRRGTTFPITAKLVSWKDLGMYGVNWWRIEVTFAEVIS